MKKILMLLQSTFPPDIRLEKEIKSLNMSGYHVTVLCNQYIKNAIIEFEGCDIIRIKAHFINPSSPNPLVNLGRIYVHLGRIKEARGVLNEALEISPGLEIAQQLLYELAEL